MDINLVGIQEPKGFDDDFNQGFPITDKENNEFEVPYYESDNDDGDEDVDVDVVGEYQYETESDYASSDEMVVPRRQAMRINRRKQNYETVLYIEDDFLPE
jgi:hypothetical protein